MWDCGYAEWVVKKNGRMYENGHVIKLDINTQMSHSLDLFLVLLLLYIEYENLVIGPNRLDG